MTNPDTRALQALADKVEAGDRAWDCPGCRGGDKWPVTEEVWRCTVCDAEYHENGDGGRDEA